ncbi:MAG TPA: Mut7-C RNAse domain-containing protein [Kofleriaceae bacterium]|nr:Mut7-C RNAse domain-containing protein [Kofleriaceae bacterium]
MAEDEPGLACDEMLGHLATWLRLLGFDAPYLRRSRDPAELDRAHVDGYVLVTRARQLAERYQPSILVHADDPPGQLAEVLRALGHAPRPARFFTRCARCNVALEPVGREAVRDRVPAAALAAFDDFTRCPRCRRSYWPGGHVDRFLRAVEPVLLAEA